MSKKALIVDDSSTMRAIIKKTFKLGGMKDYQIIEASNGKDALSVVDNQDISFILVDINMPVMDGTEFVKRMREKDLMSAIPIIAISTEGSEACIKDLKSMGVDAYVRKPFTPETLREIITDVEGEN